MNRSHLPIIDQQIRQRFSSSGASRRLFHGPGGGFAGLESLSIDYHPGLVVLTSYGPLGPDLVQALLTLIRQTIGCDELCVLWQYRQGPQTTNQVLWGELPQPAWATEDGLRYRLRLQDAAQNLGFFGDMRHQRQRIRQNVMGKKVLNLFAYTCSFSVAAVAGGAAQVVNLDMNRGALDVGRENHRDNDLDLRRVSFLAHDLFSSWGKLKRLGPFDLIVLDPPAAQGKSFTAETHWPKLLRRSAELLTPQGRMLAALNAPHLDRQWLRHHLAEQTPQLTITDEPEPPEEFAAVDPERGLKLFWLQAKG